MKSLLTLLCFALSFCTFAQFNELAELDTLFDQTFDHNGPSAAIAIAKDGVEVYNYKTGFAHLEELTPITDKSIFGVASISKQFTAAGIYILESQGKLTLEDDLRTYLNDFPFYTDTIRIKHLLHHTSGIRNTNVLEYLSGNEGRLNTNNEVYELLKKQKGVNNTPGAKMLYSNSNYVLLALVIEKVSEKPFSTFIEEQLFRPLGMESAFFVSEESRDQNLLVNRYIKTSEGYQPQFSKSQVVGPGGMGCSLKDLLKWTNVFSQEYSFDHKLRSFLTCEEPLSSGEPNTYRHGVFETTYKGFNIVHHSGRTEGSRSQLICVPALNLSLVMSAGTNAYNLEAMSYQVLDFFLGEEPSTQKTQVDYAIDLPEDMLGNYQEFNSDLGMVIYEMNDTLFARSSFGSHGVELVGVGELKFARKENRSVTYTFIEGIYTSHQLWVDFSGATFKFQKVQLADPSKVDFSAFEGSYFSDELDVSYHFEIRDDELTLSFPQHTDIPLHLCRTDEFGSFDRTLYSFERNDKGEIVGFYLASEGTVFDVYFEKMN